MDSGLLYVSSSYDRILSITFQWRLSYIQLDAVSAKGDFEMFDIEKNINITDGNFQDVCPIRCCNGSQAYRFTMLSDDGYTICLVRSTLGSLW